MTHRKILTVVLFLFAVPMAAQKFVTGVARARKPADSPYTVQFDPTPIGSTSVQDCYYNCFITGGGNCNYSGTISLLQSAKPPFHVVNLRKGTYNTNGDCSGTPVTLPVTLQAGEWLLQDFLFTPTAAGTFTDQHVYTVTPTNSPSDTSTWILQGSTPSATPAILSFAAVPSTVTAGQPTTLSWLASGATSVSIDNGVGSVSASGSTTVSPPTTTTYTLTATNNVGNSTATVTVTVINTPSLSINALPQPMLEFANTGGGTTTFIVANNGGAPTNVTISKSGNFFNIAPASFTLAPNATQAVTVTAIAQPGGVYEGSATVTGSGVSTPVQVPIKLLSANPPNGTVTATPATNRVDTSQSTTGSVSFTNTGTATLTGVLSSDVPWLIPQSGIVTIPPNSTGTFSFTVDRSKRSESDLGSTTGRLIITFLRPTGKIGALDTTPPSVSTVSVVDTPPLTVGNNAPPPLAAGEVALFVPGVGHVVGSVGTFISDVSVMNPPGNPQLSDLRFFYSGPNGTNKSTSLPAVGNVSVSLADVVKNVFATDAQVGSLQIRSASAAKLAVNANIFVSSNPAGTYGTSIPTFRSDRAVGPGGSLVLSGILQNATAHTNFFIQETSGNGVTVQTQFLDPNGVTLGTRSDTVAPFALMQMNSAAPAGTAAAILTNMSTASGAFLAYATPIDNQSSDNWAVADWSRLYGYVGSDPVIVPVAGVVQGANNSFFRTDLSITNTGTSTASGTLQYFPRGGSPANRTITLGAHQTMLISDVIGTFFGISNSVGWLQFTPAAGAFAMTNRTYTTSSVTPGTYGSAAPVLPASALLTLGAVRAIGSLQDATTATIAASTPASFRTNFGLVETSGNAATVRVTLRFNYPAGQKLQAVGSAFKDFALAPNQFLQLNNIGSQILGSSRDSLGDLRGLEVDFQVISGSGTVAVYTSSIDNGTNDSILRTE